MHRATDPTPDAPIRRRSDGSIDTDYYADRARSLRNACLTDTMGGAGVTRWLRCFGRSALQGCLSSLRRFHAQ